MLIQLKQREIEQALQMYVSSQGISLAGKTVEINFTSGRKDNGMTADIDIQDTVGYVAPTLVEGSVGTCSEEPVQIAVDPEPEEEPALVEPEGKSTSLFNS